eukprot:TRINITY_DN4881_c0_g1_i1.p3 TRINITY_DN4881_c0_g1~~TRINITY_DN4881_c0_g1_i1.p3  ORF type:complete len:122 (-),score=20.07 TRINITY_DN4881_c0_g1_i1:445-810(-)
MSHVMSALERAASVSRCLESAAPRHDLHRLTTSAARHFFNHLSAALTTDRFTSRRPGTPAAPTWPPPTPQSPPLPPPPLLPPQTSSPGIACASTVVAELLQVRAVRAAAAARRSSARHMGS